MQIAIIGPNTTECSKEIFDFGLKLGEFLGSTRNIILCGGMGGFMEAVCKGIKQNSNSFFGQTVGILPSDNLKEGNPYLDIRIPTGIGIARNIIIINSADIVISCAGGAGTLSELAFAWQKNKKVLCITQFGGWSKELAGKYLDHRNSNLFIPVSNINELKDFLFQ